MAAIRTKQLKRGGRPLVQSEENKEVVVSLREIAAGYIKPDYPAEDEAGESCRPDRASIALRGTSPSRWSSPIRI